MESLTPEVLNQELLPRLPQWRRCQALKFRHHLGQIQCAKSFLMLEEVLRNAFGVTEEIEFDYGKNGKPFLKNHPEIHFSLSHCKVAIFCVVDSHAPVGCDVESIRRMPSEGLLARCCNEAERRKIEESKNPTVAFLELWTRKEACAKLTGVGIEIETLPTLIESVAPASLTTQFVEKKGYAYSVASAYSAIL